LVVRKVTNQIGHKLWDDTNILVAAERSEAAPSSLWFFGFVVNLGKKIAKFQSKAQVVET